MRERALDGQRRREPSSGWLPTTRLGKLCHLLLWTALFYGLTWGIARLCQWLSP